MKLFLTILVLAIVGVMSDVGSCAILPSQLYFNNGVLKNSEMKKEIWKDVKGYEGLYQVSNLGRIKRLKRKVNALYNIDTYRKEKILNSYISGGYFQIKLVKNGIKESFLLHRLIAIAFIDNIENKKTVNHIDGNKLNNEAENLEWATQSENLKHAYRIGLKKFSGYKNGIHPKTQRVIQKNINGEVVACYSSIKEAINKTKILNISSVCRGIRKTAGGFIWEYKDKKV